MIENRETGEMQVFNPYYSEEEIKALRKSQGSRLNKIMRKQEALDPYFDRPPPRETSSAYRYENRVPPSCSLASLLEKTLCSIDPLTFTKNLLIKSLLTLGLFAGGLLLTTMNAVYELG